MGDERKDQNLPARPASSLMGQLVRQRQASDVVPANPQTGVAGQQQQTGMGGRERTTAPGQGGAAQRPGGGTGVQGRGQAGGVPAEEGPSRADIERIDAKDDFQNYAQPQEATPNAGDVGAKFSANQQLIREREKLIIDQ